MSHDKPRGTSDHYDSYLTPSNIQLAACPPIELLENLDKHLHIQQRVDEIGIIYIDSTTNGGDSIVVPYHMDDAFSVPETGKLGIASWSLRRLFDASRERFHALLTARELSHGGDDDGNDGGGGSGGSSDRIAVTEESHDQSLLTATRALLVLHPSSYTAWNSRKDVLQRSLQRSSSSSKVTTTEMWKTLTTEIHFVDLVFTLHPKISEAWEHRSWCVREMLRLRSDAESGADRSVMHRHELDVCEAVAVRYPKNYYAWSHR